MNRREFLSCAGCAGTATLMGCAASRQRGIETTAVCATRTDVQPQDLSYCGINCRHCDVYKATTQGDLAARARAAKLFAKTAQEHWGMAALDPMVLDCTGCRSGCVQHHGYGRCPIPPCARKRNLASCGLCPDWRTCQRLAGVFADEPQARTNLEAIARRAGL